MESSRYFHASKLLWNCFIFIIFTIIPNSILPKTSVTPMNCGLRHWHHNSIITSTQSHKNDVIVCFRKCFAVLSWVQNRHSCTILEPSSHFMFIFAIGSISFDLFVLFLFFLISILSAGKRSAVVFDAWYLLKMNFVIPDEFRKILACLPMPQVRHV